jgi:hypothetical protein
MTSADNDEQNHRFIEQGRVRGRKILSSLSDHVGSPVDLRVRPRIDLSGGRVGMLYTSDEAENLFKFAHLPLGTALNTAQYEGWFPSKGRLDQKNA